MTALTVEFGPSGLLEDASPPFLAMVGVGADVVATTSLFEVVHPPDIPLVLQAVSALTLGVPAAFFEARIVAADGAPRTLTWSVQAANGGFVGLAVDVTASRLAEGERTETRLRMALAVAEGGAWDYQPGRDALWLDATFLALFGIPADARVQRWADLAAYVHPDDGERFTTRRPEPDEPLEFEVRLPGAGERHIAFRGRTVRDGGGRAHIVGVAWNISQAKALENQLLTFAMSDHLTGVPNRRGFELALKDRWRQARRSGDAFAYLMVDIDNFKAFNDERGHLEGDAQLVAIARTLSAQVGRPGDVVARYGGEEFAVLLAEGGLDGAMVVANRMVAACRGLGGLTVSVGAAVHQPGDASSDEGLRRADAALYAAKAAGKDRAHAAPIAA